jgi:hypothetical protein
MSGIVSAEIRRGEDADGEGWPASFESIAAAVTKRTNAATTDATGLAVPPRWSDAWWVEQLRDGAMPQQFEALYGLPLTYGWSDADSPVARAAARLQQAALMDVSAGQTAGTPRAGYCFARRASVSRTPRHTPAANEDQWSEIALAAHITRDSA